MTSYNIYFKPTDECQLKCKHCYAGNDITNSINDSTFIHSIEWINKFVKNHPEDTITVILHGGECTLFDLAKLQTFVKSVNGVCWGITTNLTYKLNEQHLKLFQLMLNKDDSFIIQTSWDHNIRFENKAQLKLWEDNVRMLLNNGYIIQPTICVSKQLVEEMPSEALFNYLAELGLKRCNFERITNTGRAANLSYTPTNLSQNQWLLEAYKLAKQFDFYVPLFESIQYSINNQYIGCRARKCTQTVYTINTDGSIATCPNLYHNVIGDVVQGVISQLQCSLNCKERLVDTQCLLCRFYQYCNGDCFQLQMYNKDETMCHGLKMIYEYIEYGY